MKEIDEFAVALMILGVDLGGLDEAKDELWEKIPEREGGAKVERASYDAVVDKLWGIAKAEIRGLTGDLPEVTEDDLNPPEPEPEPELHNVVRINDNGSQMSWNSVMYQKFVFPKTGPEYTDKSFFIRYSTGDRLDVHDPKHMTMRPDNTKYQPGGVYSNNNPDIPTMEVYAPRGEHVEWVEAVFQHYVDTGVPDTPTPEPSEWTRLNWGGKPNDPDHDRRWWTKIHGDTDKWWRKFPLPKWIDDRPLSVDFRFSDGTTVNIPNTSVKSDMNGRPNGPKYRSEELGESDPRKQHPKISERYGANAEWVEFKVRD